MVPRRVYLTLASPALAALLLLGLLASALPGAASLSAQSITGGNLGGQISDQAGRPLARARVVTSSPTSGWEGTTTTSASGRFQFTLLPPGEYEVFVEIIGYRPARVMGIPVRPGSEIRIPVSLAEATPPVMQIDTVPHRAGVSGLVTPSSGRWLNNRAINTFPDPFRNLASLATYTSRFDENLGSEGLPAWMTQTLIDGIPFSPARHPVLGGGPTEALMFPRSGLAYMAFPDARTDVEWQGGPGGYATLGSRSAETTLGGDVFGSGSQTKLWNSRHFKRAEPDNESFWGGATASIPLIQDSTRVFLAIEGFRTETPRVPALSSGAANALSGLGADAAAFGQPWLEVVQGVSGAARVDWALSPKNNLEISATGAALEVEDGIGVRPLTAYGDSPPVDAIDISASATLTSRISNLLALEVRAGFQRSTRDYPGANAGSLPGTRFVGPNGTLGLDPDLSGRVSRTGFAGGPTLHINAGAHQIKLGGQLRVPIFSYETPRQGVGQFTFSDAAAANAGTGSFVQAVDRRQAGSFTVPTIGAFFQYSWDAAPGLRVTTGGRYDREDLPDDEIALNQSWLAASGLANNEVAGVLNKFSGRVGLEWDLRGDGRTILVAGAGVHQGEVDPAAINDVLSLDVGSDVRRGVGTLGAFPGLPDETAAPVVGERIALFGPELESPRTERASLGIWQLIGNNTALGVSGSFRRTEFLLRRTDLNLLTGAIGTDQFGRPVYGDLIQQGTALTADPGSNRRFAGFDQVWGLSADGWSEQKAVTVSLDHKVANGFELFGSYTWSETTDNWLGVTSGRADAQLDPGIDELMSLPWSEGTSDLDVPHRVAAGFTITSRVATLTALYRYRSGLPFTPGYRAGVDANGDGSALNDVAFVPDDPILLDLTSQWDCLSSAIGRFAERNSCRGDAVHSADVRLALNVFQSSNRSVELVFEGLNLIDTQVGLRDTALLLVDPSGTLTVDPSTGSVTVPVTVNPNFGKINVSTNRGRIARVGFRIVGGLR